jgi:glycosyltransferase involved in cell wall biosynthesis
MPSDPVRTASPRVTVLIAAFSRQDFLVRAVRSVVESTLPRAEFEILVVKNFLNPEIDAFLQAQSACVLNEPAAPIGAWMAKALTAARGTIVCLLNDDDEFEPEKLARVIDLFRTEPNLTFVHDRRKLIDPSGASLPLRKRWNLAPAGPVRIVTDRDRVRMIADCYDARAHFYDSCMSFVKTIFDDRLDTLAQVECGEDAVVFFCAMAHPGTLLLDDRVLTRFRLHGKSTYRKDKATTSERFDRKRTVALVERMTRGTPAETAGRLYALGQTFNQFLSGERNPPPPPREYWQLVVAVARHRVRSQAVVLFLAVLKRFAPGTVSRLFAHLRDQMDDAVA